MIPNIELNDFFFRLVKFNLLVFNQSCHWNIDFDSLAKSIIRKVYVFNIWDIFTSARSSQAPIQSHMYTEQYTQEIIQNTYEVYCTILHIMCEWCQSRDQTAS